MKKYLFVLVFTHFLLASCCKTEENPQHVNKFTCKVNGVFWEAVPYQNSILGNDLRMDKSPVYDIGLIFARNDKKNQVISLDFTLNDTIKKSSISAKFPYGDYSRNCNVYYIDTLSPRIVTVTNHDKDKRIVMGTFSFRAINKDTGCVDTATITNGFFDMHY